MTPSLVERADEAHLAAAGEPDRRAHGGGGADGGALVAAGRGAGTGTPEDNRTELDTGSGDANEEPTVLRDS